MVQVVAFRPVSVPVPISARFVCGGLALDNELGSNQLVAGAEASRHQRTS